MDPDLTWRLASETLLSLIILDEGSVLISPVAAVISSTHEADRVDSSLTLDSPTV